MKSKINSFTGGGDNTHHLLARSERYLRIEGVGPSAHEYVWQSQSDSLDHDTDFTGARFGNRFLTELHYLVRLAMFDNLPGPHRSFLYLRRD